MHRKKICPALPRRGEEQKNSLAPRTRGLAGLVFLGIAVSRHLRWGAVCVFPRRWRRVCPRTSRRPTCSARGGRVPSAPLLRVLAGH